MKRSFSSVNILVILAMFSTLSVPGLVKAALVIPTISIISVDPGNTVTVQTHNYPANDSFDVLMNTYGTLGIGGTRVDTINSGAGGSLTFTFKIPEALAKEGIIAIRLQSPTSGYYSFNWFYNKALANIPDSGSGSNGPPPGSLPAAIPTISILSVEAGKSVTIQTRNYPASDTFDVLMGKIGTQGVGGVRVDSVSSGAGGALTFTFSIPTSLVNERQIAIRLQSAKSGYYSYNWFWNTTASGSSPAVSFTGGPGFTAPKNIPAPGDAPTITIVSIEPGVSVKVTTKNFPANHSFNVLMGKMGTLGIGGVLVDVVNSSTGGSLTYTFDIPASLAAERQIAIRMQTPATGYYSYNWFWNRHTAAGTPVISGEDGSQTPPASAPASPVPPGTFATITISSVVRDSKVTVQITNFAANDTLDVYMNKNGTLGMNGIKVDSVNSGSDGKKTFTFKIPEALKGQQQIAIRMQSVLSDTVSVNWFWNTTYP